MMFFTRSLPSILAGFEKTIVDLGLLIEAHAKKTTANNDKVIALDIENYDLLSESSRAATVKTNLEKLISGDA